VLAGFAVLGAIDDYVSVRGTRSGERLRFWLIGILAAMAGVALALV
jgi:hypothetical protein